MQWGYEYNYLVNAYFAERHSEHTALASSVEQTCEWNAEATIEAIAKACPLSTTIFVVWANIDDREPKKAELRR